MTRKNKLSNMMRKRRFLKYFFFFTSILPVTLALAMESPAAAQIPSDDTVPPVISNIKPTGTINSTSTTLSADYSDPEPSSGIDSTSAMIHLDGRHQMGCTATATSISCPKSGLTPGKTYKMEVFVSDNAGNDSVAVNYFSVAPDTTAPVISNIQPFGTISTASPTLSADYSDPVEPSSGIDPTSAMIHLDGIHQMGCTATATNISCPSSGLTVGTHTIEVYVRDYAGNEGYATGSFEVIDKSAPKISISASNTAISGKFNDPAPSSGINPTSANVRVDGIVATGCTATVTEVSCSMPTDLGEGMHSIEVSVADNAGNTGQNSRGFLLLAGRVVLLPDQIT